jgi:hypothetical protein
LALVALLGGVVSTACADESFTPEECEDPPTYDIRKANEGTGAVSEDGIVQDSPLSAEEQRRLQQLADDGCITLPKKSYSLDSAKIPKSAED